MEWRVPKYSDLRNSQSRMEERLGRFPWMYSSAFENSTNSGMRCLVHFICIIIAILLSWTYGGDD